MKKILAMLAVAGLAAAANGQVWAEVDDAPAGVPARQDTIGAGALTNITGVLTRGTTGDHVDTYSIVITNVADFYASTKQFFGGSATTATGGNADTRLWLWTEQGAPVLANDDVNTTGFGTDTLASFVSDPSTFTAFTGGEIVHSTASNVSLVAGQKYLLSIALFPIDAKDAANVDLINLGADFDALHGVNPNSNGVFNNWEASTTTGLITYNIALSGAAFCAVPAPASMALLGLGGLVAARRRRA